VVDYALVFITNVELRTLPMGLSTFITGDGDSWDSTCRSTWWKG